MGICASSSAGGKGKGSNSSKIRTSSAADSQVQEDANTVSLTLEPGHVSRRRLSTAHDLISSGRPLSITLVPSTNSSRNLKPPLESAEDEFANREMWKDQLHLMRKFYDWEEIPLDFFVDTYVGAGQQNHRRLSVKIQAEPLPQQQPPQPLRGVQSDILPTTQQPKSAVPVDFTPSATKSIAPVAITPDLIAPMLPPRKTNTTSQQQQGNRPRATSVALGDSAVAVLHQHLRPTVAAAGNHALLVPLMEAEHRERRPSITTLEQVYGRRAGEGQTRFEFENPALVVPSDAHGNRRTRASTMQDTTTTQPLYPGGGGALRQSLTLKNYTFDAVKFASAAASPGARTRANTGATATVITHAENDLCISEEDPSILRFLGEEENGDISHWV